VEIAGGIFLLQADAQHEQLVRMDERAYDSEELLQRLLAKYPNLLAGDQINSVAPRRWLLVTREATIPSSEGGSARWAVDHLFLDQDAVPTIVEVKRSSDTRIRREVVGQLLEYAANAVVYWPMESIRARYQTGCELANIDAEQGLQNLIGPVGDAELFRQQVKTNLQAGKVRLVFVADVIPPELRRIVEFLNGQMDPAQVLAIEVRQYIGEGQTALVPRVFGQTEQAQLRKNPVGPTVSKQWDEGQFLSALEPRGSEAVDAACGILEWARTHKLRIWWGRGAHDGSFFPMIDHGGAQHWLVSVWTYGRLEVQFEMMVKSQGPFEDVSPRMELLRRLNDVPGFSLPSDGIARRPSVQLAALGEKTVRSHFLQVLDWVVEQVRAS